MLGLAFDLLFLALNRCRVVPLYTWVDASRLTESRTAHTNVSGSVTYLTCLTIQVTYTWRFTLMGLKPPSGLGTLTSLPHKPPSSIYSWASYEMNSHRYDPAPPGRVIPDSHIPNSFGALLYDSHGLTY